MRRAAGLAMAAALGLAGCGKQDRPSRADDAVVIVRADVGDAALWLDGRYIGPVGSLRGGISVPPGAHRLELRHDEHFSFYAELELGPHERRTIDVDLAPILP